MKTQSDAIRDPAGVDANDLWVFGYGSLVWKPAFEYRARHPGFITGWARRFWQKSIDHRGVPEAPGRVVTLIPASGATCWGMVYRVDACRASSVIARLDHREQGGYAQHRVDVHLRAGALVRDALVYVATPDNPEYGGPAQLEDIAAQIRVCCGPSGTNAEYALKLAASLRALGAADEHVFALEALLLAQ